MVEQRATKDNIKINKLGSAKPKEDNLQQSESRIPLKRVEEEKKSKNEQTVYAADEPKSRMHKHNKEYNSRASLRSSSNSTASLKELLIGTTGHFSIKQVGFFT
jgi:hypothetical protein